MLAGKPGGTKPTADLRHGGIQMLQMGQCKAGKPLSGGASNDGSLYQGSRRDCHSKSPQMHYQSAAAWLSGLRQARRGAFCDMSTQIAMGSNPIDAALYSPRFTAGAFSFRLSQEHPVVHIHTTELPHPRRNCTTSAAMLSDRRAAGSGAAFHPWPTSGA